MKEEKEDLNRKKTYWQVRRRLVIGTLCCCYLFILYFLMKGVHDSKLHESIVSGLMTVVMGTIVGYIGGAVYVDINDPDLKNVSGDFWKIRRWVVITNVLFSGSIVIYLINNGVHDSRLHSSIVSELLFTSVVCIVSYIGGASIQDRYMKKIK